MAGAGAALAGLVIGLVVVNGPLSTEPEPNGGGPVQAAQTTPTEPEEGGEAETPAAPAPASEPVEAAVPEAGGDPELERAARAALDTVGGGTVAMIERKDDDEVAYKVRAENERGEFEVEIGHDFHVVGVERKGEPEKEKEDDDDDD